MSSPSPSAKRMPAAGVAGEADILEGDPPLMAGSPAVGAPHRVGRPAEAPRRRVAAVRQQPPSRPRAVAVRQPPKRRPREGVVRQAPSKPKARWTSARAAGRPPRRRIRPPGNPPRRRIKPPVRTPRLRCSRAHSPRRPHGSRRLPRCNRARSPRRPPGSRALSRTDTERIAVGHLLQLLMG